MSLLSDLDLHLLTEGKHYHAYERLGAHPCELAGARGTRFAVWAPGAHEVAVIGDFNGWDPAANPLEERGDSGYWEVFVPGASPGALYKYRIRSKHDDSVVDKADPY